jgi:hypothetical protein
VVSTEPRHVDDFIDDDDTHQYAAFVLDWMRTTAARQMRFGQFMSRFRLFCTHGGKRYRVTMASRLGDVGLSTDLAGDGGYSLRVAPDECADWSCSP